jgi:3-hydroxyacyl-CoA dehydrogenase/enoyl-CoA hydratase/3-hydroxybutyryl-CoA epimerase
MATADYGALADCDLVIEAVFEDRNVKGEAIAKAEAVLGENAIFASNTSTLPISSLAQASKRPEKFIGVHFFSPVERMGLVEIILGKETSERALSTAIDYVRKIKKTPIVVNDSRGFYTSRCFSTYTEEGLRMVSEKIAPALIENIGRMTGMPMGPLRLIDEIGVDITVDIANTLEKAYGERDRASKILLQMREEKLLGRKSGGGFYKYEGKQQLPNESLEQWRNPTARHPEQSEGPQEPKDREVPRSARNDDESDLHARAYTDANGKVHLILVGDGDGRYVLRSISNNWKQN